MKPDQIIDLLGGYKELCKLLNVNKSAISNYKKRGKFPSYTIPIIINELKSRGVSVNFSDFMGNKPSERNNKTAILIVSGGISAYKSPEVIRRLKEKNYRVIPVLTRGGSKFITSLTLSAVAEEKCYSDLFNFTDVSEMGHIQLARMADLIVIAPASANIISKIASGITDDLATTLVLASNCPIFLCPAMNPLMWSNSATQENILRLKNRSYKIIGPEEGVSACGEFGVSRLSETSKIIDFIENENRNNKFPLLKKIKILITAGPTIEPIDDVRYISNHSSGKQGYSIADEFAINGSDVTLISGPVNIDKPKNIKFFQINTAEEMLSKCINCLPVDIAIFVAAVSDWKIENKFSGKIKKGAQNINFNFVKNPDILEKVSQHKKRPKLIVGFSAETEKVMKNTKEKLLKKGCDWILGNKVGTGTNTFGGDENSILFASNSSFETWPKMSKSDVAKRIALKVNEFLKENYNVKN